MKISEFAFFIGFGLVASYIGGWAIRDRLTKKRIIVFLRKRSQQDDGQFGQSFSPGDSRRAELAVRVRKVLAKNLELPLGGLRPDDKLDADLGAELTRNPNLFWELEEEFGIQAEVEDYEAHQKGLESLVTFADLVDYVASRVGQGSAVQATEETPPAIYEYAIRSIPVLCITGLLMAIVGAVANKPFFFRLGIGLFLGGVAVWGLANGGGLVWKAMKTVRAASLKDLTAHPWWVAFYFVLTTFFIWFGVMFLRFAVKVSLFSK